MRSMTLEYRRECRQSNVLDSLTSIEEKTSDDKHERRKQCAGNSSRNDIECTHLLRMEADQVEIVRARSVWQIK